MRKLYAMQVMMPVVLGWALRGLEKALSVPWFIARQIFTHARHNVSATVSQKLVRSRSKGREKKG